MRPAHTQPPAHKPPSAAWQKILRMIPDYDAIATAKSSYFSPWHANHILDFFSECLTFIEGERAGQPFKPDPWQRSILANLFGWLRLSDHTRRYRESLIYVPKKQGKTPIGAGIILYSLFCQPEAGAQIYSAAADRDQAALLYRHAKGMMLAEPELASRGEYYETSKTIVKVGSNSKYQALSSDVPTKHGLNSTLIVVDELHAQPNRLLVDALITSTASREQPLVLYLTTADFHRPSLCNQKLDYAQSIQNGRLVDEAFLPVIYQTPADADWKSEKVWKLANPGLGRSVKLDYMRRESTKAKSEPSYENTFKRLHLNMKTSQDITWITHEVWTACTSDAVNAETLHGKLCYVGVDMAATTDLCALALWFPTENALLFKYWLPALTSEERYEKAAVPYPAWVEQGFITTTPGNVCDYDRIRHDITDLLRTHYKPGKLVFDKWNSTQLQTQLQSDGFDVITYAQSNKALNAPTRQIERLALNHTLRHAGDPVTTWMLGNVRIHEDADGNQKPSREHSTEKIDGIIAMAMAIGAAMLEQGPKTSIYETRGFIEL